VANQLWYTFYLSIGIGVVIGLSIKAGVVPINVSFFSGAITDTANFFRISGQDLFYFSIAASIAVIAALLIGLYHATKLMHESGEYGIYAFGLGLFGGLLLAAGLFGIISVIGLMLIILGVILAYRIERAPPGTPDWGDKK
jgi:hypothetical protein